MHANTGRNPEGDKLGSSQHLYLEVTELHAQLAALTTALTKANVGAGSSSLN